MTLPRQLVLKKNSPHGQAKATVSTLTMSFIKNHTMGSIVDHTLTLWGNGQELVEGSAIDVWLWMASQTDTLHPLYRPFEDIMPPTHGLNWFYTELDKAEILSDKSAQGRVQWLWTKMHEPQLMASLMQRFMDPNDQRCTILDGVFPFVVMYHDAANLHTDPLWMAWWQSPHAEPTAGAKVLENLCLSGQASPIPAFVDNDQRSSQMMNFFNQMCWDTLVARQLFSGVRALADHFKCDMPDLLHRKNLIPSIGGSLLNNPRRWDKVLGEWCTSRTDWMGAATTAWFSHHLARNLDFLFFREEYQQQWVELQRRGFAPRITLTEFQKQLSEALEWDLRTKEIPYEYRSEWVLTAAIPLIEKAVLMEALQNDTLPPKNASSSRRKM